MFFYKNAARFAFEKSLLIFGMLLLSACVGTAPPDSSDHPISTGSTPLQNIPAATPLPGSTIRFTHLGIPEGLSQSVVNCILQDEQGFLWIGTQDGLNRYDGYEFKIYRPDPNDPASLSDLWINTLFQDSRGFIWVGTRQGGLNRFDPHTGQFTRYLHDPARSESLISNRVQVIFEDSEGVVWVGTALGLDRFIPTRNGFEHYDIRSPSSLERIDDNITSIYQDGKGDLWIGTTYRGLNRYSKSSNTFTSYTSDPANPNTLSSNSIQAIQGTADGTLWIATDSGLDLFHPQTGLSIRYQHNPANSSSLADDTVRTLALDRSGSLWIGTNAGLDRLDPSARGFVHYQHDPTLEFSLSNNMVTALHQSADGVLWVGTYGGGLNLYNSYQDRFTYLYQQPDNYTNLSGSLVEQISIDEDQVVWIATLDGGLNALDPRTGRVSHYLHDPADPGSLMSNEVWSVHRDRAGTLWVGSRLGLDRLDPGAKDFIHYRHDPADSGSLVGAPVYSMLEDRWGNLWVATDFGLDLFDPQSGSFRHYQPDITDPNSLSGREVISLFEDRSGMLWVGTFNDGLNRFDPQTGRFTRYQYDPQNPKSLSNNSVLCIYQDSLGTLWIGTAGGGLNRFNSIDGSFIHFLEKNGLPNNVVYGILEDRAAHLWLSTNNGISDFNPFKQTFRNYSAGDGLQGNEFNMNSYARDAQGNLYFGGVNGLTIFDPVRIVASSYIPPIALVSFTQDGKPIQGSSTPETTRQITIRWPDNYFEFEFSALSYAQPAKNQYAYFLQNFDKAWHSSGSERGGQYTNLPGGKYTLHLKGSNQDGVWNDTGLSIQIIVIPPFWQTWWFRGVIALGILALVFAAYRMRVKDVETYNRELERQVRDRTSEIERLFEKTKELAVVEERNRLARELHDSAKQKAFAAMAQLGTANGILSKDPRSARSHLVEAENLVYEVIEELTFLIQEMYPLALKEKGLAATLREYVFEWEGRTDIQAEVHIQGGRKLPLEVEQAIYRVIQESLSNVARHSHATRAEVVLSYSPKSVEVVISDNGCGFDPAMRQAGFGLRSIHERIESLGGKVHIDSAAEGGTRLTVHVATAAKRKAERGAKHA